MGKFSESLSRIASRTNRTLNFMSDASGLNRDWAGRQTGEVKAYTLLQHLYRAQGVRGSEMFLPPQTLRGDCPDGRPLAMRAKERPSIEEVAAWMEGLADLPPPDHPIMECCNVFRLGSVPLETIAVGRLSVLCEQAGIHSPELMDRFIRHSDQAEYDKLISSMQTMTDGEVRFSRDKLQTLYIPPDRFELHRVDTVKVRVGRYVINYALTLGWSWKRDDRAPYAGTDFPALISVRDFEPGPDV